jgi:hypothetical protein
MAASATSSKKEEEKLKKEGKLFAVSFNHPLYGDSKRVNALHS